LIGDSIIKHIEPRKLSRKRVYKYSFPGKKAEDIAKEVYTITVPETHDVSRVIVHAGTKQSPN
jgi:hypothetical protein